MQKSIMFNLAFFFVKSWLWVRSDTEFSKRLF